MRKKAIKTYDLRTGTQPVVGEVFWYDDPQKPGNPVKLKCQKRISHNGCKTATGVYCAFFNADCIYIRCFNRARTEKKDNVIFISEQ